MSIYQCGYTPIHLPTGKGIHIMSNGEESIAFGTTSCRSSWACPKCTAKVMAKYGEKIGCAIEALAEKDTYAMMFTLTIPHLPYMSCKDTYTILQEAYRAFTRDGKTLQRKHTLKDGTQKVYTIYRNAFAKFKHDLDIKHSVRVYETTYGKNSWHFHIHGLWWTHKKNWHAIAKYEESIFEYWWKCITNKAKRYWNEKYKDEPEKAEKVLKETYAKWRKEPKTGFKSLYISKNPDGTIRKANSSYYICGWASNNELTGLAEKRATNGHMTPHQILEAAYLAKDPETEEKYMNRYLEYTLETRGHCRVYFSMGLNQIIANWQKTESYKQVVKKKATEYQREKYHYVIFILEQQWLFLCELDMMNPNDHIIASILELAREPDGKDKIIEFCGLYGIDLSENPVPSECCINWVSDVVNAEQQRKLA